jgi:hypothetical protein
LARNRVEEAERTLRFAAKINGRDIGNNIDFAAIAKAVSKVNKHNLHCKFIIVGRERTENATNQHIPHFSNDTSAIMSFQIWSVSGPCLERVFQLVKQSMSTTLDYI